MKILFTILAISFFSMAVSQTEDEKHVLACYEDFTSAILQGRIELATNRLTEGSIKYYDDIRETSLYADSTEVAQLNLMDRMLVFTLRHTMTPPEIDKLDGYGVFEYHINSWIVDKQAIMNTKLGAVQVAQGFATARIIVNGQESPIFYVFYNEEGWKFDITLLWQYQALELERMIREQAMSEDMFVTLAIGGATGRFPGPDIWQPMM